MSDVFRGGAFAPHRIPTAAAVALLVLAAGCATRPVPERTRPAAPEPAAPSAEVARAAEGPLAPAAAPGEPRKRAEIFEGTGQFIDADAASQRRPDRDEEGEVTFNFEGQPIQEVVKAILGDLLEENYVIAPGISGNVTFSTANPIPRSQALKVLEMLLSWNNAAMVHFDGRYHVVPTASAVPGHLTPTTAPLAGQRGFEVRAYQLQYLAPAEMQKLLQPYARESAFVSVDNARGLLVLAGTRQELENYQQTIRVFDVDWLEGMSIGVYAIERVEAELVAGELETVFGEGSGTPLAGMFRFLPVERLNSIIVITPQPKYLDKAAEWIERLDRGGESAGTRLYVYKVKNVKATDLADTLSDVFGSGGRSGSRTRSGDATDPFAPGLEVGEITSINDPRRRAREEREQGQEARPAARREGEGVALVDGEDIRITAVEEQNSLLIRATPQQYDSVLDAIKRLDIEPLQVLIEVMILEVTLNENLNYGVQWFFENAVNSLPDDPFGAGTGGDTGGKGARLLKGLFDADAPISPDRSGSIGSSGLSYAIRGGDTAAFVTLLEAHTDVRAIAAPSMLVLNNREANINVGTQIPVTSTVFSTGTGNNLGANRVQFRDTGVTLNVVPRVNPGGMVFMEVAQEVSNPVPGSDANNQNFSVSQRRLDTEVAVQSGETVVLGGLIQINDSKTKSGLPGLSRLPLVGGLFGSQGTTLMRTELLVMITPRVVANMDEAREVSREYRKKMDGLEPLDLERLRTGLKLPGTFRD